MTNVRVDLRIKIREKRPHGICLDPVLTVYPLVTKVTGH